LSGILPVGDVMLELKEITKTYPLPGDSQKLYVLDSVSLRIEKGNSIAIVGPSGCGKSTLLNITGALDRADKGDVILEGVSYSGMTEEELSKLRSSKIGFIFQLHHLLAQCTVLENVLLPTMAVKESSVKDNRDKAISLLEMVGLSELSEYSPGQLSGGQRQRVAVARSLINDPAVLLADEPTGSLDQKTSDKIMDLLCDLNENNDLTLVMVTHSLEHAKRMKVIKKLEDGRLTEQ
jgi:ABC-type lipoprotein export system ATPase subunit